MFRVEHFLSIIFPSLLIVRALGAGPYHPHTISLFVRPMTVWETATAGAVAELHAAGPETDW
jgi:hypothetical protein